MHMKKTVAMIALALLAGAAQADVAVTADLGTTGVGAHIIVPMEPTLNGRFGINYYSRSNDRAASTISYDLKDRMLTGDVLFDWYVIEGSPFHLTGGVLYNGNRMKGNARPDSASNYLIAGKYYSSATVGTLTATLDYGNAAPYVGIGWGNALKSNKRISFQAEVGAYHQGNAKASIVNVGCTGAAAVCAALAKDVVTESAAFAKAIDARRTVGVARVSVSYRF